MAKKKTSTKKASTKAKADVVKQIKFKDDAAELAEMADFYKKQGHARVYFVYDLKAGGVVAVEVMTDGVQGPLREGRSFYNYKNRLLSVRKRLDANENGDPMIGYESISGNDTRLSKHEQGIVATGTTQIAGTSPFERAKAEAEVAKKSDGEKADYESGVDEDGREFERFETFKVVRMK